MAALVEGIFDSSINDALTVTIPIDTSSVVVQTATFLLVGIVWMESSLTVDGVDLVSVTFNGVGLTFHSVANTGGTISELWYSNALPNAGAYDVVVTFDEINPAETGSVLAQISGCYCSGASSISPAVSATGNDAAPTIDCPSTGTDTRVIDLLGYQTTPGVGFPTLTQGAGQDFPSLAPFISGNVVGVTSLRRITGAMSGRIGTAGASTLATDTHGTTSLTSAALFEALVVGMHITGTGIPADTFVASITDSSTIVMSQAATDSTSDTRTFTNATSWTLSGLDPPASLNNRAWVIQAVELSRKRMRDPLRAASIIPYRR